VMLAVSVWRGEFGVNWGAPLIYFAALALAETGVSSAPRLHRLGLALTVVLLVPLSGVLLGVKLGLLDPARLVPQAKAQQVLMHFDLADGSFLKALRPLLRDRVPVALEYGIGADLRNDGLDDTVVFSRSVYGRNDDLFTDFRALEGRNMVIIGNGAKLDAERLSRLFDSSEIKNIRTGRQRYDILLGDGFSYDIYRQNWILPIITNLYDKSPFPAGACFMDRYR